MAAALSGCTFDDGEPFATVTGSVRAAYELPADRASAGGWQRLSNDYEVQIERAALDGVRVALEETGSAGAAFDPARPPPGYSLCHGGHCHADDGRLVPYDEVAAAGGAGAGPRELAALAAGALNLLAPADHPLACQTPPCELPFATVRRVRMTPGDLTLSGRVRDGASPPRLAGEHPFAVELAADALAPLTAAVDLPADGRAPPRVELRVAVTVGPRLLDGVPWGELPDAPVLMPAYSPAALARLAENAAGAAVSVLVSRHEP
jgi:hypothetical protein